MLASRDQENLIYSHQAGGPAKQQGSRPLVPKTPSTRFLSDKNAVLPCKSVLHTGHNAGQENVLTMKRDRNKMMATPQNTRPRAVLGDKTTNAKAKTGQSIRVKDAVQQVQKTQAGPTSTRKHKLNPSISENIKVETVGPNLETDICDVETIPKNMPDLPYESDIFPKNGLTFEGLKRENMFNGFYRHYHDPVDENGVSLRQEQFEREIKMALEKGERKIEREIESLDWSVPDVPSTKSRPSKNSRKVKSTISARDAATALSMPVNSACQAHLPKSSQSSVKGKVNALPAHSGAKRALSIEHPVRMDNTAALVASRTTLGYTRGRAIMNKARTVQRSMDEKHSKPIPRRPQHGMERSASSVSADADKTINPATYDQQAEPKNRPDFISIFDPVHEEHEEDDGLLVNPKHFLESMVHDDEEINFQIK